MNTEFKIVDLQNPEPAVMAQAGAIIQQGGLVAFPTETVYGLGANALDPEAVRQIFIAKGRPTDNPMIVHIADWEGLAALVTTLTPIARTLGERFWPGPLTLVLPRHERVPSMVAAGLDTIAVRWPDHPVAEALIRAAGVPIAAPSANRSGRPSPTEAGHVMEDLVGQVELILVSQETGLGLESTVLDLTGPVPLVLRPGGITIEQLRTVIPNVTRIDLTKGKAAGVTSPGIRHTHYAPAKPLFLIEGVDGQHPGAEKVLTVLDRFRAQGQTVGLLCCRENAPQYQNAPNPPDYLRVMGSRENLPEVGAYLFKILRECDLAEVDLIIVESFPETGLGIAIMDRLRRACGERAIEI